MVTIVFLKESSNGEVEVVILKEGDDIDGEKGRGNVLYFDSNETERTKKEKAKERWES